MEQFFLKVSVMLVPALLAVTCHELSHGLVADRCGDHTARSLGRLTLNPLRHLDIVGTIMLFIAQIGWAKPVPVNFNNLRHPRIDMIWVAAAGPLTNFILAAFSAGALRLLVLVSPGPSALTEPVLIMLTISVIINLSLGLFNLLPVLPLDGGRMLAGILPYRQALAYSRSERYGLLVILAVFLFFPGALAAILGPFLGWGLDLLVGEKILDFLIVNTKLAHLGLF